MTAWDLLATAAQRWFLTLCGVVLTGLAVFWVTTAPPVYYSHATVVLLPPPTSQLNGYNGTSRSLIDLAGAVARSIEEPGGPSQVVSGKVTLVGEGRTDGYVVRQKNAGSQWNYRFTEPTLDVQAVGTTAAEAEAGMAAALERVKSTLATMQDNERVHASARVRTRLSPATPQLSMEDGSQVRAVAATALAGGILTLMALASIGPTGRRAARVWAARWSPRGEARHQA